MSENKSETAEQWFSVGSDDIRSAEALLEAGIYRNVCFLSQQAVEKYVKGRLVHHQKSFPKTHFLSELVALLQSIQPELIVDRTIEPIAKLIGKLNRRKLWLQNKNNSSPYTNTLLHSSCFSPLIFSYLIPNRVLQWVQYRFAVTY